MRVIFVDGDPARSQYVSLGGHEVPQWLWDAGFVEGGAGATHPDFQRAGPLRPADAAPVPRGGAVRAPLRPRGLPRRARRDVRATWASSVLETRTVEPKPGWRFRSHLLYADAERLLRDEPASPGPSPRWPPPSPSPACRSRPERGAAMVSELASQLAAAAARRDVTTFAAGPARRAAPRTRRRRSPRWSADPTVVVVDELAEQLEQLVRGRAPGEQLSGARLRDGGRAPARRPRAGCLRHVGLLSVEPPAGARPARAAAPRAAPGPQPLRDHPRRAGAADRAARRRRPGCRSGARSCRRWRTRASAASCGSPTSTCSTSRTSTGSSGGVADVGVSKVVLAAREVAELDPYIRVVAYPGRRRGGDDRRVRRRRRRGRRRVRRPGDEGAPARARARRRPAGGDGHEPSRDARRRALRPRARAADLPRAARRRHLGRARRADDQAEGPVRDPHPRPGEPHATARRRRWSRSRRASRRGRSSRPTSRSAARWWPTPCGGSRSASSRRRGASTPISTS